MSGHTGSGYLNTHRYAARIKDGEEKWMPVLPPNIVFTNLNSIFVTSLVLGGTRRRLMTSRFPRRAASPTITMAWARRTASMMRWLL